MKKQFARLFLGFVAVVVVVLAIQVVVFVFTSERQQRLWGKNIYQFYVQSLSFALTQDVPSEGWNLDNIDTVLLSASDDRVSGLLLRDSHGNVVTSFGKTGKGVPFDMPDRRKEKPLQVLSLSSDFNEVKVRSDLYVIALTLNSNSLGTTYTTVSYRDKNSTKKLLLPPPLKAKDIAGSIDILFNGKTIAKVDVLAFSPFTYQMTSRLLSGLGAPFLWSIPFAFVVALFMAARISKRSQNYIRGIQHALDTLAKGEHDVPIPKTNIEENIMINASIVDLDSKLKQHELSRQEWLRSIGHDLNTPVTSMKLILDGMDDGVFPITKEGVATLKKENDELAERISSVVLYSKLLSPDTKAVMGSVDLDEFTQLVLGQCQEADASRVVVHSEKAKLTGDCDLLVIACDQLLKNALKATKGEVTWLIGENRMVFTNEGKLRENVDFFEPWTKGDASRDSVGNGLGLAMVAQIMRLHKGKARIYQQGEVVTVELGWIVA
ncbi:MAG: HAMP domain-containing sensor histidine kinase [Sphaerochaetaceae bacterium]